MDRNTLIAEIIKAIAWPLTITICLLLFRSEILSILRYVRKIKLHSVELEFSEQIQSLKSQTNTHSRIHTASNSRAMSILPVSPKIAIMEAWLELETTVISSVTSETSNDFHQTISLSDKELYLYKELGKLRNKIAHVENIQLNEKDVTAFISLCAYLVNKIKKEQRLEKST